MHAPDLPRFHVVEANKVKPRFGKIAARPLYVYLPEAARHDQRRRFPVLYCHDGQNLWDDPQACFGHGGWYLNRIVDELTDDERIEPLILVGIPNTAARYREYSPGKSFDESLAHPYANYVCDVVKRYVDRHFPTKKDRAHTGVLGSSMGGLVSLWMAHEFPETFGKAACLSGAFQVRDQRRKSFLNYLGGRARQDLHIYIDSGTVRDDTLLTRKVHRLYRQLGWRDGKDLLHYEEPGGEHNERCWRGRVWRALTFLFGHGKRP